MLMCKLSAYYIYLLDHVVNQTSRCTQHAEGSLCLSLHNILFVWLSRYQQGPRNKILMLEKMRNGQIRVVDAHRGEDVYASRYPCRLPFANWFIPQLSHSLNTTLSSHGLRGCVPTQSIVILVENAKYVLYARKRCDKRVRRCERRSFGCEDGLRHV